MGTEYLEIRQPKDYETARTAALTAQLQRERLGITTQDGRLFECEPHVCMDFRASGGFKVTGEVPDIVVAGRAARFGARFQPGEPGEFTLIPPPEDLGGWWNEPFIPAR